MDDGAAPMEEELLSDAMEEAGLLPYIERLAFEVDLAFEVENDGDSFVMEGEGGVAIADEGQGLAGNDGGREGQVIEIDSSSDDETLAEEPELTLREKGYTPPSRAKRDLSEGANALLYWKVDKEESFSDWTIKIRAGGATKDYHVHRNVLAFGPKRSGYFEALFQSGQFRESASNTSEVSLPEDIAARFPDFLNYLYSPPSECERIIEANNCYALHYLAQYFLVQELTKAIDGFISEDAHNLSHLEKYLPDFCRDENEVPAFLRGHATRACAEMILSIEVGSPLLLALPRAMFLQIIATVRHAAPKVAGADHCHICKLAIDYVRSHQDIIDERYFYALTSELYFPKKHAGPLAVDLLKIAKQEGWEMHTFFKQSCVNVLSRFLSHKDQLGNETTLLNLVNDIPQDVIASLLASSFSAKAALDSKEESMEVFCRIMSDMYGVPVGYTVKMSLKPTDTVDYIKYRLCRHLNRIPDDCYGFSVYCQGSKLDWDELVCNCTIASGTELKIKP